MYRNQSVGSLRRIPFSLFDSSGAPITGQVFPLPTGPTVQVSKAGGAFIDGLGEATEIGSGHYYYQAVSTEVNTLGILLIKVVIGSAVQFTIADEVIDAPPSASVIAQNVWDFVSEGTERFGDTVRLIAARLFGKAIIQDGDGGYSYRDLGDTKNRIEMTRAGSARNVITRDGT